MGGSRNRPGREFVHHVIVCRRDGFGLLRFLGRRLIHLLRGNLIPDRLNRRGRDTRFIHAFGQLVEHLLNGTGNPRANRIVPILQLIKRGFHPVNRGHHRTGAGVISRSGRLRQRIAATVGLGHPPHHARPTPEHGDIGSRFGLGGLRRNRPRLGSDWHPVSPDRLDGRLGRAIGVTDHKIIQIPQIPLGGVLGEIVRRRAVAGRQLLPIGCGWRLGCHARPNW